MKTIQRFLSALLLLILFQACLAGGTYVIFTVIGPIFQYLLRPGEVVSWLFALSPIFISTWLGIFYIPGRWAKKLHEVNLFALNDKSMREIVIKTAIALMISGFTLGFAPLGIVEVITLLGWWPLQIVK